MKGFDALLQLLTPQRHQEYTTTAQNPKMRKPTYKLVKKQDPTVAIKPVAATTCCALYTENYPHLTQKQIDVAGWEEPTEIVTWRTNAPPFHIQKTVTLMGRDGNVFRLVPGQKVKVIELNPSGLCMIAAESGGRWIWRGKVWRDYLSLAPCIEWRAEHLGALENAANKCGGGKEDKEEWVEESESNEPPKKILGPCWERDEPCPRCLQSAEDAYDDEKIPIADNGELEGAVEDEKKERQ